MEPALNIPVDLNAVELSRWETAEVNLRKPSHKAETRNSSLVVVNLPEQVTARQSRALIRDLRDQLTGDQPTVLLDLSDVKEMDTAGLDLLLECLRETVRRDGTIQIRGLSPEAATVLELTGMDEILGLTPEPSSREHRALDDSSSVFEPAQKSLVA